MKNPKVKKVKGYIALGQDGVFWSFIFPGYEPTHREQSDKAFTKLWQGNGTNVVPCIISYAPTDKIRK